MPRGIIRRVPNHEQRALRQAQDKAVLDAAIAQLTPEELDRYELLAFEVARPLSVTEELAILERARAHVRGEARAESDKLKGPAQVLYELFGER